MTNYYFKNKVIKRKGQLGLFFIAVILIIIIATLITVNIGKIARTKTYTGNSTDAGALAAASTLAYAFNYVAKANEFMEENYKNFNKEAKKHFEHTWMNHMTPAQTKTAQAITTADPDPCGTLKKIPGIIKLLTKFIREMEILRDKVIPDYHDHMQDFYEQVRETVHDDEPHQNDLYNTALVAGHKLNFLNSGIAVKRGEKHGEFRQWVDTQINPQTVQNNVEKFYPWYDPGGRQHVVGSKINIDPIHDYNIRKTQKDYDPVKQDLMDAMLYTTSSIFELGEAAKHLAKACWHKWLCLLGAWWHCPKWHAEAAKAIQHLNQALDLEKKAELKSRDAWNGIQIDKASTFRSTHKTDTNPKIICWVDDIDHDREVEAYNRQIHQSNVGESSADLWETEYPEIKSSTLATFNYEHRGYICAADGGDTCNPIWEHDAAIIQIDFE